MNTNYIQCILGDDELHPLGQTIVAAPRSLGALTHLAALLLQPARALLLPLPTKLGARLQRSCRQGATQKSSTLWVMFDGKTKGGVVRGA